MSSSRDAAIAPYARELEVATAAARSAGEVILALYGRAAVSEKPDGTVVTQADYASDAAIRAALSSAFPGDALLTEEGADDPARLAKDRCWIVDPIDGTAQFVARTGDFDVFIALAVGGAPVAAVSYQPTAGLLLSAVAGRGAWIEQPEQGRRPLRFSVGAGRPVIATKGWLGAPENLARLGRVASRLEAADVVADVVVETRNLCARALLPGAGSVDAIAGIPAGGRRLGAWEWDLAAVDLIVREAGGAVTDLAGRPLRYNRPTPRFDDGLLLSRSPALHEQLLAALAHER
ncbi:3'(2'),5'-bisphosphate nucleotidase CysQ family protein [Sorangium sp. So ce385]|uniref:3'(2'),5'-bisphosphate nucleotidase CysQ family protein n=1 Tax=Sorangium sp. So ce385 TaxID=3133308 RepID=UPI003F5B9DB5